MSFLLKNLIQASNQRLLLPFYHMVSNDENSFAKYLYPPRKIETFKQDLDFLLENYKPISLQELIKISKDNKLLTQNVFHLTFDDGLTNFYKVVAPILKARNIPATVFVNTNFVDNKELFYRYKASLLLQNFEASTLENQTVFKQFFNTDNVKEKLLNINFQQKEQLDTLAKKVNVDFDEYLKTEQPYLFSNQIEELIEDGFTIGAHSKNHPLFSDICLKEQIAQTEESLAWLQKTFNINYRAFSFPFTDFGVSKDFFTSISPDLGISFGTSGIKKDNIYNNFQRISFELADENIESFLVKSYTKYMAKIPFNKHIMPRD